MTAERIVYQPPEREPPIFAAVGELREWQCQVALPCVGNSRLIFAVCCAFGAPLLRLLGEDGGGFNLLGGSRTGKSTALRVAASVLGCQLLSWHATPNALESVARGRCDTLVVIDEIGQVDPRVIGAIAYMLAAGQGKSRASRTGGARQVLQFLILFLSTGEMGLADKNAEAGLATMAGQEVRLVDVPADAGQGFGIFEDVHGAVSAAVFADELRDATGRYYGTPYPAFMRALVARVGRDPDAAGAIRARVHALRAEWLAKLLGVGGQAPDIGGQVMSVAFRFAMVAIGGELATEFDIPGWPAGTASAGVERCFRAWLADRGTLGAREDEQAVTQLRDFILTQGSIRFEPWHDPDDVHQVPTLPPERFRTGNRAGWRRATRDDDGNPLWTYYFTSAGMTEAMKGLQFRAAIKLLVARKYITPDKAGKSAQSTRIPGHGKIRCYVVNPAIMTEFETP